MNYPSGIYLLKVNNRNTRTKCDMFKVNNKDTQMTPMACSGAFIVNFEHISDLALMFLLLTLNM